MRTRLSYMSFASILEGEFPPSIPLVVFHFSMRVKIPFTFRERCFGQQLSTGLPKAVWLGPWPRPNGVWSLLSPFVFHLITLLPTQEWRGNTELFPVRNVAGQKEAEPRGEGGGEEKKLTMDYRSYLRFKGKEIAGKDSLLSSSARYRGLRK